MFSLPGFPTDTSRYLDTRDKSVDTVIITPSYKADVSANLVTGDGRETSEGELPAFCAGVFLYTKRGIPNEELEVESLGKIYRVIRDSKDGKIAVILPKCKVLYTSKKESVNEIEIFTSAYSYKNYIFKLAECENSRHFADTGLRTVLRNALGDSIDGVAAYSVEKNEASVKFLLAEPQNVGCRLYIFLAIATAVLSKHPCDSLTVKYDGCRLCVKSHGGELAVFDETLEIFTLSLPDIE